VTQMKVIEENGQTTTTARDEGVCDCGCGCGMGVTPQPSTEAREEAQLSIVAADEGLCRRLLGEPYGCCGTRRFS
jgi:hypothetical protein